MLRVSMAPKKNSNESSWPPRSLRIRPSQRVALKNARFELLSSARNLGLLFSAGKIEVFKAQSDSNCMRYISLTVVEKTPEDLQESRNSNEPRLLQQGRGCLLAVDVHVFNALDLGSLVADSIADFFSNQVRRVFVVRRLLEPKIGISSGCPFDHQYIRCLRVTNSIGSRFELVAIQMGVAGGKHFSK